MGRVQRHGARSSGTRAWVVKPLDLRDPSRAFHLPFFTEPSNSGTHAPDGRVTQDCSLPAPGLPLRRASESGISGSLHARGGAAGRPGRVLFPGCQSSLRAQRHPLSPSPRPPAPVVAPGSPPARRPGSPAGLRLGDPSWPGSLETPSTLLRSQLRPLLGKASRNKGRKTHRAVEGMDAPHLRPGTELSPPKGAPQAGQGRPGGAILRPRPSRAFSPPPSLTSFPVPGTPPRAAHCRPQ